jgi:hypothetical protein
VSETSNVGPVDNGDGTVTVRLRSPLNPGPKAIDSLTFQRMRAKHMRGQVLQAGRIEWDLLMTIASRLTGIAPSILGELEGEDMQDVLGVTNRFLASFLPTGE